MKKTMFFGLPALMLLAIALLASCATTGGSVEEPVREPVPLTREEAAVVEEIEDLLQKWKDENLSFVLERDGSMRLLVSVVFRANYADFEGLSEEILTSNTATLNHVAEILRMLTDHNIRIEGHANPTTPPGPQRERENPELMLLSEQRAQRVLDELSRRGVPLIQKSVLGLGGTRTLYDYTDSENNWMNRRVEFILYIR